MAKRHGRAISLKFYPLILAGILGMQILPVSTTKAENTNVHPNSYTLLSRYKNVSASSYTQGNYSLKGNDGNTDSSRWSAAAADFPQSWTIDLGAESILKSVVINWYMSESLAWKYRIEVSNDNKAYKVAMDKSGNAKPGDTEDILNSSGRYVRITVTGCSNPDVPASFYESRIYGSRIVQEVYPLKASSNGRYLMDQSGRPYFLLADTGWMLFSNLTRAEAEYYLEDRRKHGVNSILCYAAPFDINAENSLGERAFINNDLSTPNDAYFDNVDYIIKLASEKGMQVIMCPAEMDSYSSYYDKENAKALGRYMGRRYKDFKNIIWFCGGDIHPTAEEIQIADSLVEGIMEYDTGHLISFHPAGGNSSSDYFSDRQWLDFNMIQVFGPDSPKNYQLPLSDYGLSPVKPLILVEPCYEDNSDGGNPPAINTPFKVRRAIAWGFLSGGSGMCYGEKYIYKFTSVPDWKTLLDQPGFQQFVNMAALIRLRAWHKLAPDSSHNLLTNGFGTIGSLDYAAAKLAEDGSFAIIYLPTSRPVSLDMSRFNSSKTIKWYDPTNKALTILGQYPNSGSLSIPARPVNSAGQFDWIMIIE